MKVTLFKSYLSSFLLIISTSALNADVVVCSDFRHVDRQTANTIAEFFDGRFLPNFSQTIQDTKSPITDAFLFSGQKPSNELLRCARELQDKGFFGAEVLVSGASSKIGTFRTIQPFDFQAEIEESHVEVSIDELRLVVVASETTEPYRSIRALEAVAGYPDGICSRNEICFNFVSERRMGAPHPSPP